jgi:hypothetical protein
LGVFAFFPRHAGFRLLLVVSVTVSAERKAGFCTPVSASKISVPRSSGDRFDDWVVGPQFEPYCLHHPVFRYRTPVGVLAFLPRNAGFRPLLVVSVAVSGERKAGFCTPVSAPKISVPRSSGDRFDDWVVGLQFEPYRLHHPALANRIVPVGCQTGRFCGDFRPPNSQTSVSAYGGAFERGFLALCLRIQKFRSRQPGSGPNSDRIRSRNCNFSSQRNSRCRGGVEVIPD